MSRILRAFLIAMIALVVLALGSLAWVSYLQGDYTSVALLAVGIGLACLPPRFDPAIRLKERFVAGRQRR